MSGWHQQNDGQPCKWLLECLSATLGKLGILAGLLGIEPQVFSGLRRTAILACRGGGVRHFFEGFVLDAGRRELRRDEEPISIEPKVLDLLLYPVSNVTAW
jgi:hypothetical protein